jgi:hypothetical protein
VIGADALRDAQVPGDAVGLAIAMKEARGERAVMVDTARRWGIEATNRQRGSRSLG